MTISELIEIIDRAFPGALEVRYVHPTLFLLCTDPVFTGHGTSGRTAIFCQRANISPAELAVALANPILELELITPKERQADFSYLDGGHQGQHWISAFNPIKRLRGQSSYENEKSTSLAPKAIHFYGYKGGQARSTVLLSLAKTLADVGFKVLVVDADIEAPSMDSMLDVTANDVKSTFMGLADISSAVAPIVRSYVGTSNVGHVDLLPCRPAASVYDMDFAAFLLNATLDPGVLESAVKKLRDYAVAEDQKGQGYDAVLFDHRTGLAPSVLPIMDAWPGPAIIFVRPDGMARHIQDSSLLDTLLSYDHDCPGAFVSFSLDPQKTMRSAREMHGKVIEGLLEKISDALTTQRSGDIPEEPYDIDPLELDRYWIFWSHDAKLVDGCQPSPASISIENRNALSQLRSIVGMSGLPVATPKVTVVPRLSSSGSSDQGQFILTPDFAKLFSIESQYTYIFGRKGTGKTRLLTELCGQNLGEPLLVANDSRVGGVQSAGPLFQQLLELCGRNFELFWWTLLDVAIDCDSTLNEKLEDALKVRIARHSVSFSLAELISSIDQKSSQILTRRVFLIDGVETAVPATDLRSFVESLFRFLAAVQFHRSLAQTITIRLFLRSDLKTGASQNVEQQIEGRVINLHWNKTAILNFALARIVSLPCFQRVFPDVCRKIEMSSEEISRGALTDDVAETLLLEIFPRSLERNKLKATTFFATYFSDTGGNTDRPAFYPRLFDGFLRTLDQKFQQASMFELLDGRLPSVLVLQSYDQASREYLADVRTELHAFLSIEEDDAQNKDAVDNLIQGFNGLSTPFVVEEIIPALNSRTGIPTDKIRQALRSMHAIGIFESRAGYPGEWRTGRLYKAGLAMKYVRKKDAAEIWTQGDLLALSE